MLTYIEKSTIRLKAQPGTSRLMDLFYSLTSQAVSSGIVYLLPSLSLSLSLSLSIYLSIYLSLPPRLILVLTYDLCEWTNVAISIPTPTSLPFPWASTKTHPTYPSHPSHHYMHSFDPPVSLWPSIYSWSGYLPSMSTITASQMLSQTMTLLPLMLGSLPIK